MVKYMKVDAFKKFVHDNPYLINYVKSNKMTWQQFYEIYDLYGEDDNIWNDFKDSNISGSGDTNIVNAIKGIFNLFKGVDINSVQKALTSLDKAIEAFKGFNKTNNSSEIYEERPKNKYFED